MSKNKTVRVTEEELSLLKAMRSGREIVGETGPAEVIPVMATNDPFAAQQALADAFVSAIERTRPVEKKTEFTRKGRTPWHPKDGSPLPKLKRKYYQHGILIEDKMTAEEINLLNQIKPGTYCEGFVRVIVRKDRGIDVDYPVRTASQRLKMVNQYGIRGFAELLKRIIDEKANPSNYRRPDDGEIYETA